MGRTVEHVVVDVSDEGDVDALIDRAATQFGRIDVLVNNAGIGHYGRITDISTADWRRVMGVDLDGVFFACRAALPSPATRCAFQTVAIGLPTVPTGKTEWPTRQHNSSSTRWTAPDVREEASPGSPALLLLR